MKLISGIEIANDLYTKIKVDLSIKKKPIKLGIVLANDDSASSRYVSIKQKVCTDLGIEVEVFKPKLQISNLKEEIINKINQWNNDKSFSGILVQLPLYKSISEDKIEILNSIDYSKDVDGLTSINLGRAVQNQIPYYLPATTLAVIKCLEFVASDLNISFEKYIEDKDIVIINNSDLIGKPLALYFSSKAGSVCVLNKNTKDIKQFTVKADIVITATGKSQIFKSEFFKQDCVLIDITSNKVESGVVGDILVDEPLKRKVSYLTPVPGGIGPLTVACLIQNLIT